MGFIGRFFLATLLLGFGELYLLIKAAGALGFGATVGACLLTGVIGGALVRRQGLATLREIQQTTARGDVPAVEIISGVLLLIVGAMLIMPGFITDAAGFLMLVPWLRRHAARLLARVVTPRITLHGFPGVGQAGPPWDEQRHDAHGPRGKRVIDVDPDA